MKIRVADLGHETQFHVVSARIEAYNLKKFEAKITGFALGYTRSYAVGGWQGTVETVLIYRVASLSNEQRAELIEFLLGFSGMKDLYVVLPGGLAQGYSWDFEAEAFPTPAGWEADEQS